MSNELQLSIGPYTFTAIGIEKSRESTKDEWERYGYGLRAVDEAKQWAIGDWLADGKSHYGDGLYKKAAEVLAVDEGTLRNMKSISDTLQLSLRNDNLSWNHHKEVASLKKIAEDKKTKKLYLSDETDYDKISELLNLAEKDSMSVRDLREKVQEYKRDQQESIRLANEPEKYSIIYADPPWHYPHDQEFYGQNVERHYRTMTMDELRALPIKNISAEHCVLYMWATAPLLDEQIEIITAWGFEYKSCLVWDKVSHNMGFYASQRHELLLIGGKGQSAPTDKSYANQTDSVYSEERGEHSQKPEYYYEMIEKMHPGKTKRIELFARQQRDGWDSWGDEA